MPSGVPRAAGESGHFYFGETGHFYLGTTIGDVRLIVIGRDAGSPLLSPMRSAASRVAGRRCCAAQWARPVSVYATSAEEFELGSVEVGVDGVVMTGERSVEVLLCYEGAVQVAPLAGGDALALASGQSCLVPAAVGGYRIIGQGRLYRA